MFVQVKQKEIYNFWLLQLKALQKPHEDDNGTGPIVQKEKVGTRTIGGNLTMTNIAFDIPIDEIRVTKA